MAQRRFLILETFARMGWRPLEECERLSESMKDGREAGVIGDGGASLAAVGRLILQSRSASGAG